MALTKTKELYESLVRYGGDKVKGMQIQYITKYYDDGVLVAENIGEAEKIAVLDGDLVGKKLVEDVHTPTAVSMQKTIDAKNVEIDAKDAEILAKETELNLLKK